MAGHRTAGQTMLGISLSEDLLAMIDEVRMELNESRSSFIRKSIVEKLRAKGCSVPVEAFIPPDRAGKSRHAKKYSSAPSASPREKNLAAKNAEIAKKSAPKKLHKNRYNLESLKPLPGTKENRDAI